MKDNLDKQPSFPELLGCPAGDGNDQCVLMGCFFQNLKRRMSPSTLGSEAYEEAISKIDDMAIKSGCKSIK